MQIDPNVLLCHGIRRHGCGLPVCAVAWGLSGGLASHALQTLSQHRDATNCTGSKGLGAGAFALALVWWWAYPMAQGACTSLAC